MNNYLLATRTKPITAFEIKTGWDIPAVLEQGINSDLPGQIKALVRENVYDAATGQYLLIPQGSRVVGTYNSHIAYGQTRVQIVWSQLMFPDGTTMPLEGMIGQDAQGASGFHDKTNNHYVRLFGMALLTSAFSAGIQITQGSGQSNSAYPSNSQLATQALGQQLGQLGMEIARKNMNVQPTITIPVGYRFNIRVNRDVAFVEPYVSMAR
jgi:type IV secretion system protein VirB10